MRGRRGFSLIELLVVICVALVLTALLAPRIVARRIYANEASVLSAVRSIQSAQFKYAQSYPALGFADNIARLGPPLAGAQPGSDRANLLDPTLSCPAQPCAMSGYLFAIDQITGAPVTNFRITAVPQAPGRGGNRGFCSTPLGVISADPAGGTACSVPVS